MVWFPGQYSPGGVENCNSAMVCNSAIELLSSSYAGTLGLGRVCRMRVRDKCLPFFHMREQQSPPSMPNSVEVPRADRALQRNDKLGGFLEDL